MSSLMKRVSSNYFFMGKIRRSRCPHCDSINVISWGEQSGHLKVLFATSFSLFFRKVISLPYSFSGFFLGRPLLVSFLSIVCLFSIL